MLKTLIEKEMREIIGSTKFAIIFGVCAFFIIADRIFHFISSIISHKVYLQKHKNNVSTAIEYTLKKQLAMM